MGTANAFDMLILPMIQCTAGICASLPFLHALRVAVGRLVSHSRSVEESTKQTCPAQS